MKIKKLGTAFSAVLLVTLLSIPAEAGSRGKWHFSEEPNEDGSITQTFNCKYSLFQKVCDTGDNIVITQNPQIQ